MRCPFCQAPDTRVIDSRLAGEGYQVRRRRECITCGERFTTFESPDLAMPDIIKRAGYRQPFDEGKLRTSLVRALQKRPIATEAIEATLARIKRRLLAWSEREIDSRLLGEWVMEELRRLDQVAYVRFASVYRSFQDVNAFREEIARLEHELDPPALSSTPLAEEGVPPLSPG